MPTKQRLKPEEMSFFRQVSQAVLANPFSDERMDIDARISGVLGGVTRQNQIESAVSEVRRRIIQLETKNRANFTMYADPDSEVLKLALLFDFFHIFREPFDRLIHDQILADQKTAPVDFWQDAQAIFTRRGFDPDETLLFFAFTYQLRRAYYFIDHGLIGRSPSMRKLRESLWNNVFTFDMDLYHRRLWNRMEDFSTLVIGETGVGKGAAALSIGRSGFIPFDPVQKKFVESFTRSFISLNLSQFPESLIESELFGHQKGAFTGAVETHKGVFNRCSPHGAIFLDEIGEVSIPVQIKLLKVLEEREYTPVGSHASQRFEGRVIAATNRSLEAIIERKILREDFFYRLCSDVIVVPPLHLRIREEPGELDDLLAHTVERITGAPSADLVRMIKSVIEEKLGSDYRWPGNVRELGQCVRSILLNKNCRGFHAGSAARGAATIRVLAESDTPDAQSLIMQYCHELHRRFGTYGEVARRTKLDRRTVKKYVTDWMGKAAPVPENSERK